MNKNRVLWLDPGVSFNMARNVAATLPENTTLGIMAGLEETIVMSAIEQLKPGRNLLLAPQIDKQIAKKAIEGLVQGTRVVLADQTPLETMQVISSAIPINVTLCLGANISADVGIAVAKALGLGGFLRLAQGLPPLIAQDIARSMQPKRVFLLDAQYSVGMMPPIVSSLAEGVFYYLSALVPGMAISFIVHSLPFGVFLLIDPNISSETARITAKALPQRRAIFLPPGISEETAMILAEESNPYTYLFLPTRMPEKTVTLIVKFLPKNTCICFESWSSLNTLKIAAQTLAAERGIRINYETTGYEAMLISQALAPRALLYIGSQTPLQIISLAIANLQKDAAICFHPAIPIAILKAAVMILPKRCPLYLDLRTTSDMISVIAPFLPPGTRIQLSSMFSVKIIQEIAANVSFEVTINLATTTPDTTLLRIKEALRPRVEAQLPIPLFILNGSPLFAPLKDKAPSMLSHLSLEAEALTPKMMKTATQTLSAIGYFANERKRKNPVDPVDLTADDPKKAKFDLDVESTLTKWH